MMQQKLRRFFDQGGTIDRILPRCMEELMAPPTPRLPVCHNRWIRRLGFAYYDAYIIASASHAASYATPTDA